jgi:methylated-DNA-[protein]-cysteine S-methyltransferase
MNTAFTTRVLAVVRGIPAGRVATYGDVALFAGRPGAARAVGNIMRSCNRPDVPCHRVVAAGGRLGGYGGSEALKRALLAAEGITVAGSSVRNFAAIKVSRPAARKKPPPATIPKAKPGGGRTRHGAPTRKS